MEPLATTRRVMTWLCMCPEESTTKTKTIAYGFFTFTVTATCFWTLFASVAFIVVYLSIDFESSLYAVFQVAGGAAMLNLIFVGLFYRHRIAAIFSQLSKICTANDHLASFRFFIEANNKSEWIWSMYFKFGMGGVCACILMLSLISTLYCFYDYQQFIVEHLYLPFRLVMPWDQHTPCGYFGEVLFTIVAAQCYYIVNGAVIILFVSMCWYHLAFYERFRHSALQLDHPENETNANASETLCELIIFHISIKNWFLESAEVYSPFILIQLICNMLALASCVFQLDLGLKHLDYEIIFFLNAIVTEIFNLFVYCYFGMLATEGYQDMAECLYESNWREKPLHLQKAILLMIQNMQKPIYYHGFGVANLDLQTFIKFMRAVYTYYMALKTLTG